MDRSGAAGEPPEGFFKRRRYKGNRAALTLFGSAFFGGLHFESALYIVYLAEKGVPLATIVTLQALLNVSMVIFEVPTGTLADRLGPRRLIIVGRALNCLYILALAVPSDHATLAAGFVAYGVGITCISGADQAFLYEQLGAPPSFTPVLGRYFSILTSAPAVAAICGGLLHLIGWTTVIGATLATQLVALLLASRLPRETAGRRTDTTYRAHLHDLRITLRAEPRDVLLLIGGLGLFSAVVSAYVIFAQRLMQAQGAPVLVIAWTLAAADLAATVSANFADRAETRRGTRWLLLAMPLLAAVGFGFSGAGRLPITVALVVALGAIDNIVDPVGQSQLHRRVPDRHRAASISVLSMGSGVLMALFFLAVRIVPSVGTHAAGSALFGVVGMFVTAALLLGARLSSGPSLDT